MHRVEFIIFQYFSEFLTLFLKWPSSLGLGVLHDHMRQCFVQPKNLAKFLFVSAHNWPPPPQTLEFVSLTWPKKAKKKVGKCYISTFDPTVSLFPLLESLPVRYPPSAVTQNSWQEHCFCHAYCRSCLYFQIWSQRSGFRSTLSNRCRCIGEGFS